MDKGKYELTHIRTFDNGVKDTFQFYTYGPDLSEDDISFYPGIEKSSFIQLSKLNKKTKTYQQVIIFSNPSLAPYTNSYTGNIDAYEIDQRYLQIQYTCFLSDTFQGELTFKWVGL